MLDTHPTTSIVKPFRFPEEGADQTQLMGYRDAFFNFHSAFRNRHMMRMAMDCLYAIGRHWIELDHNLLTDGPRGFAFRDISGKNSSNNWDYPQPVTNYVGASVEIEAASLNKRQYIPTIYTDSKDPRIEAAAKAAKDILQYRLRDINWDAIRELATFYFVVTGTTCIKSFWDAPYTDITTIASPTNVSCQACGYKFASPTAPSDAANQGLYLDTASPVENGFDIFDCPHCGNPLNPYQANPDELDTPDMFGRKLGLDVPRGDTAMEVVSPFDLFPENSGIDLNPNNSRIWGQATVRDLDWIHDRYPSFDIAPDDPMELMRYHPILGEWSLMGRYSPRLDTNIYQNHSRIYEQYSLPTVRYPKGRALITSQSTILFDGPLIQEVKGVKVPIVTYGAARYKERPGEFWGHSLVDDLLSPQNRLNGMDSQTIEARERMGSPNLLAPKGAAMEGPEWFEGYGGGKVMLYEPDPLAPNAKPEVFGSILMPSGVYEERQAVLQDMKQIAGPQDVEIGEAPRNISTTSGLQILGEQAEKRRGARERALLEMYQKVWDHQLKLLAAYRVDEDTYEVQATTGTWEQKQFDRNALQNIKKLVVEKQAYVDKSLLVKEASREAQADGLIDITTQQAKKRLLELRGLPTDINEDLNRQVDLGKKQWVDFIESQLIPVIDETLDDPRIRFQAIGTLLLGEKGKELEEIMQWPLLCKGIAGWEEELQKMEMNDAMAIQQYGGRLTPEEGQMAYAQQMTMYTQQLQQFEQAQQAGAQAAATGIQVAPMMPPQQPVPPVFLPPCKEDRVFMAYMRAKQLNDGVYGQPTEFSEEQINYLKFRAVVDAYKLLAEEKEMQQMMGMPVAEAPGTPGGTPGMGGASPGLDFKSGPANPPNPNNPPVAPGVGGNA